MTDPNCPGAAGAVHPLVSKQIPAQHSLHLVFTPEHLKRFERRVAKRIRDGQLDKLCPLQRAVHNCLARVVDLKAGTKARGQGADATRPRRSRNHSRTSSFKIDLEGDRRLRRTRPAIAPLDLEAAHAHPVPTNSPPESPSPTTPVDDVSLDLIHILGAQISSEGVAQSSFTYPKA